MKGVTLMVIISLKLIGITTVALALTLEGIEKITDEKYKEENEGVLQEC